MNPYFVINSIPPDAYNKERVTWHLSNFWLIYDYKAHWFVCLLSKGFPVVREEEKYKSLGNLICFLVSFYYIITLLRLKQIPIQIFGCITYLSNLVSTVSIFDRQIDGWDLVLYLKYQINTMFHILLILKILAVYLLYAIKIIIKIDMML